MHRTGQTLLPQLIAGLPVRSAFPFSPYRQCQLQFGRPQAWIQPLHTGHTGPSSATKPKSNPSSSLIVTACITAKPSPTRPSGAFRKRTKKVKLRQTSQDGSSSTRSNITTLFDHLTSIHPGDYSRLAKGAIGERRIKNLTRLHGALQNTEDPDEMWEAYEEIRKARKDLQVLTPEVLRLLVIHFKEAASLTTKSGSAQWDRVSPGDKWHARIVAVLDDKRSLTGDFSRWDYSDLMSSLNRLGRHGESLEEFERIKFNTRVDPILLNHAVRAWGGLGQLDKAVETIQDVEARFDAKASEYTLGYLIQQYIWAGEKPKAIALWKKLTEDDSLESIDVVNGILKACVGVQESSFAQDVYDALPGLRIESNVESLNLMLSLAVAEIQYSEERSQFLRNIHEKITASDRLVFDRNVLSSILTNFSKKGDAEGAILVHELMGKHGFRPDIEEHNDILHCYARLGETEKAIEWFHQMRRAGNRPNRSSYMLLMHSFTRQRMPRETEALFRQLICDGIKPDLTVCNHLLLAYEQARMNRRCLLLYKNMFNDRSIGLDQLSFSCIFNAVFHSDKALMEGGEGRVPAFRIDRGFLKKIEEPIPYLSDSTERKDITMDNEERCITPSSQTQHEYQFDDATSTTESLNPRTLFRDMIIVGIRPSRSLYSNILRAFLAQSDFAGATVALRALVDYFVLRPTPKMNAIIVTWVCQELQKRGVENNSPLSKGEISKVISMMERTRGLIEMLERVVNGEQQGSKSMTENMRRTFSLTEPLDLTATEAQDNLQLAKMEMGGDLVDLYSRSSLAGSSWSTTEDSPTMVDLKDFERWYKAYANRKTVVQAIKENPHFQIK
ncbi:hypothetical protein BGX27_006913 [Mortierella sp. AM989]|nr:hypothetical protein BGX27_006913 [Mortierella sp. AM989]